ncbi:hypothetical protein SAMN06297387_106161 [Streptomyces zhaozhouensis]|uniref:DsrE/DsrF-like family protein n=1 Tax=Streptomyces zhaozhouensis TaxID=1300267 RepID=A0A286DVI4_9ACTN|nr:hypothetical protein [Streptomyces zhaozhouensis]SOD62584.1 hypothetical protein SAMN06297387_106161 [Streptomyces zhaozhouensis]
MNATWEGAAGRPRHLLVESQGRADVGEFGFRRDAVALAAAGRGVLLYLVQDGVALALPGSDERLDAFQAAGGTLAADDFSLAQRGLADAPLRPRTQVAGMDDLARWVLDPDVQVVWH